MDSNLRGRWVAVLSVFLQSDFSQSGAAISLLDVVDTDGVVGPAGEQVEVSLAPAESSAAESLLGAGLVRSSRDFLNSLNELGAWKVENLDALLSSDDEPVQFLGEQNTVDWGFAVT